MSPKRNAAAPEPESHRDGVEASVAKADFLDAVSAELAQMIQRGVSASGAERMVRMWQRIGRMIEGGKRSRPALVHLGFRTFGGRSDAPLVKLGCAVELLHTAFVVHDDVIDRDFMRRGGPTLSAEYRDDALEEGQNRRDAEHVGHSAGVLAGDILLAEAIRLVHESVRDEPAAPEIVGAFHAAILSSAAGELDDVLFATGAGDPDLDRVLQMHRLKTAAYSFEAPLRIGALLAGAAADTAAQLAEAGAHLGIGYQVIDDVLGTFGDPDASGKPVDSDLRERKFTVLIALLQDIPEAEPVVHAWRDGEGPLDEMRTALTTYGIEQRARMVAQLCCDRARAGLESLPLTAQARAEFDVVMDDLQQRGA